jgi:hypothetical protein
MKKTTLLITLFITFLSFSQESRLTIFSDNGEPFYVILNGLRQNEQPVTNIAIDQLPHEYYDTKIIFANQNIPILEKKHLMMTDVDGKHGEFVYKIKQTKRGRKLRFYSFTEHAEILPPPSNVTIIQYNTIPLPTIQTTTTTTTTIGGSGDQINVGINANGTNVGIGVNINTGTSTTTTTTTTSTTTGNPYTQVEIVEEVDCYAMSSADFSQALNSIKGKTFSDSKLTLAKQITKGNCLTAAQISKITNLFDYESDKLEYAKFAYPFCYNPENYWKVNEAFEFESSIEELNEFIEN